MNIKTESISIQRATKTKNLLKSILNRNSHQFCRNSSLNGLKYIADRKLYPRERFFFALAFITVIALTGSFIQNVWIKWSNTPVITSINPNPSYIIEDPFPAVTICNLNVAYKSKAEKYSIYSPEYAMLQMMCKRDVNSTVAESITDWSNFNNFLTEMAQPCSSMLLSCRFGSVKYNCSEIFKPVITDEGLCCAFNKLHPFFVYNKVFFATRNSISNIPQDEFNDKFIPVAWSPDNGYQENLPHNRSYYPRPAVGVGETLGLSLTLNVESDEYYCSSLNSVGFKIAIHSPIESPSLRELGLLLAPGQETKILVNAEKYESDPKLRSIHYRYRQCWLQDEIKLQIFSHYSQSSCEKERLAKTLLNYCGCISYYLPRIYGNESICSIYDLSCVEEMRIFSKLTECNTTLCKTKCLPSCNDLKYFPKFFSAPLIYDEFHDTNIFNSVLKNMSNQYVVQNIVIVNLFQREYIYRSFKKTVYYSGTDALSNIGGLISLFVGFSFMSFAELVFYALVKPVREICQIITKKKNLLPKDNSTWKKPIRKRYNPGFKLGFNRNVQHYGQVKFVRESYKRKLYSKRHFLVGVDNGY